MSISLGFALIAVVCAGGAQQAYKRGGNSKVFWAFFWLMLIFAGATYVAATH